ncbi:hypothetical protein ABVK25_008663 [Lepraria finkii]|uniref:Uncharacterized protein n=1 Tax=Lepraria finkii TaxID=1340010 RepID=A0ABR4AZQ0_9LECA
MCETELREYRTPGNCRICRDQNRQPATIVPIALAPVQAGIVPTAFLPILNNIHPVPTGGPIGHSTTSGPVNFLGLQTYPQWLTLEQRRRRMLPLTDTKPN